MLVSSWFERLINSVNNVYERRIRAASQVTEYGAHHGHGHHDDEDEGTVISNVPPGTRVQSSPESHEGEARHETE